MRRKLGLQEEEKRREVGKQKRKERLEEGERGEVKKPASETRDEF